MIRRLILGSDRHTESRVSIQESLRIFRRIEKHMENKWLSSCATKHSPLPLSSRLLFERLVTESADTNRLEYDGITSCGLTSQCFAALFFSQKQINSNSIPLHTNGSDFVQLWDNWNIVLYSIWKRRYGDWTNLQMSGPTNTVTHVLKRRAENKTARLSVSLLRVDSEDKLPRVVFCNLTWVLLNGVPKTPNTNEPHDPSDDVKDHQWSIIKHRNNHFQVVQGYMLGASSPGHCLSAWQNTFCAVNGSSFPFSSRHGFCLSNMEKFLDGINNFATSSKFDTLSYQGIFGVFHSESKNRVIWPSVSFRELGDESIEGYGERFVANGIARNINLPK